MRVRAWERWRNEHGGAGAVEGLSRVCSGCGAELPVATETRVRCAYCRLEQDNPTPLAPGTQVLSSGDLGLELGRVASCEGPERVHVDVGGSTRVLPCTELTPVVRAMEAYACGLGVFVREPVVGWKRAWIVRAGKAGEFTVREDWSRDAFFDKHVAEDDLRVEADPRRRRTRTSIEVGWERAKAGATLAAKVALLAILVAIVGATVWAIAVRR